MNVEAIEQYPLWLQWVIIFIIAVPVLAQTQHYDTGGEFISPMGERGKTPSRAIPTSPASGLSAARGNSPPVSLLRLGQVMDFIGKV
jgi:hypothetical protein